MTNLPSPPTKARWNPWPTGLFLTLAAFVVVQLSVVTLAATSFEGLDDVEYYRHGVEYGQEIARQKMQSELGWNLDSRMDKDELYLAIQDADGKPVSRAKVSVTVGRPATVREDSVHTLSEVGPGIYKAPMPLAPGDWRLRFEVSKGETLVKAEVRRKGAAL